MGMYGKYPSISDSFIINFLCIYLDHPKCSCMCIHMYIYGFKRPFGSSKLYAMIPEILLNFHDQTKHCFRDAIKSKQLAPRPRPVTLGSFLLPLFNWLFSLYPVATVF